MSRVDPVQVPHQAREVRLPRVQHKVIVVAHQAVRQHLSIEPVYRPLDDLKQCRAINVVDEDRLASVATRGDVIDSSLEFDAQRA